MNERHEPSTDDRAEYDDANVTWEHMIVEALAECARAGAPPDAVDLLAHECGVARAYGQARP